MRSVGINDHADKKHAKLHSVLPIPGPKLVTREVTSKQVRTTFVSQGSAYMPQFGSTYARQSRTLRANAVSTTFPVPSSSELVKLPSKQPIVEESNTELVNLPSERPSDSPKLKTIATHRGESFIARFIRSSSSGVIDLAAAEAEHTESISCFSLTDKLMSKEWGSGITVYFKYVVFCALMALVQCGLTAIPFALNYDRVRDKATMAAAFLALYQPIPTVRIAWIATTASCIVVTLLFTTVWRWYRLALMGRWRGVDRTEETMEAAGDSINNAAVKGMTQHERDVRRALSLFAFMIMVGAQAVVTYYLHVALARSDVTTLGLVVAAALATLNLFEKNIAKVLTVYEGHTTITMVREWDCAKVFALKISNVLVVYLVQALTVDARRAAQADGKGNSSLSSRGVLLLSCLSDDAMADGREGVAALWTANGRPTNASHVMPADAANWLADGGVNCSCPLLSMGWTFFFMVLTDILFGTVIDAILNWVFGWYAKHYSEGLSDEEARPEFDTAEKYVQLWNRTFLILLGAPVFPLVAALGFFGFCVQYVYDRWALVTLCRKPVLKEEPLSLRLTLTCACTVAVAAAITYPNGMAFIFAKMGYGMDSCHFFRST